MEPYLRNASSRRFQRIRSAGRAASRWTLRIGKGLNWDFGDCPLIWPYERNFNATKEVHYEAQRTIPTVVLHMHPWNSCAYSQGWHACLHELRQLQAGLPKLPDKQCQPAIDQ